jgi:hypothetical protein
VTVQSRKPNRLVPLAVACFVAGILGVLVILGLFAAGQTELPWWLNVAAIGLTTIGFALGLVALVREARRRG